MLLDWWPKKLYHGWDLQSHRVTWRRSCRVRHLMFGWGPQHRVRVPWSVYTESGRPHDEAPGQRRLAHRCQVSLPVLDQSLPSGVWRWDKWTSLQKINILMLREPFVHRFHGTWNPRNGRDRCWTRGTRRWLSLDCPESRWTTSLRHHKYS